MMHRWMNRRPVLAALAAATLAATLTTPAFASPDDGDDAARDREAASADRDRGDRDRERAERERERERADRDRRQRARHRQDRPVVIPPIVIPPIPSVVIPEIDWGTGWPSVPRPPAPPSPPDGTCGQPGEPPPPPPPPPRAPPAPPVPPVPPVPHRAAHGRVAFDETRAAVPTGAVEVVDVLGSVKVVGWSRPEVRVQGTRGASTQLELSSSGDRTRVRVVPAAEIEDGRTDDVSADLEIHVPAGSTVEIKSVSAPVEVHDTTSVVRVEAVSGGVSIDGAPSEVSARTIAGDVDVDAPSADTRVRSVSGAIHLHRVHGRVRTDSVSGTCDIHGGDFTEAAMQTVNGDVDFEGALVGDGVLDARSHGGRVRLALPARTSAEFELRTFSGSLESDLGERRSGQRALEFRTGSGDAHVRVRTFSGDVEVHERQ